jgi:DNA polymerase III delta prime subunit
MELNYPPPHYLLFEPLNDIETSKQWKLYKAKFGGKCEFSEIDAAEINSVDTFAPWFENWIRQTASRQETRMRILMIFHAEFLTYSCQQMLRRSLEERSFNCRVWFHVEDPTTIQPAIQSRCIVKRMPVYLHTPQIKAI